MKTKICNKCKYYEIYQSDMGTDNFCRFEEPYRHISEYKNKKCKTPDWCPLKKKK